ncbi:hypothetical protein ACTXT7_006974 [Hymenolepis weldensis]
MHKKSHNVKKRRERGKSRHSMGRWIFSNPSDVSLKFSRRPPPLREFNHSPPTHPRWVLADGLTSLPVARKYYVWLARAQPFELIEADARLSPPDDVSGSTRLKVSKIFSRASTGFPLPSSITNDILLDKNGMF